MNEVIPTTAMPVTTVQRQSLFAMEPEEQVKYAVRLANIWKDICVKQKLTKKIGPKEYQPVEAWQTLGSLLGVLPKERLVNRLPDGSYEAYVDLVKYGDGAIVGGASALCSINEKRWGDVDEFARRSMAITRATGKAYRVCFAWIVTLAGYEAVPFEEMPDHVQPNQDEARNVSPPPTKSEKYTGTDSQQNALKRVLETNNVPIDLWDKLHETMKEKQSYGKDWKKILGEISASN